MPGQRVRGHPQPPLRSVGPAHVFCLLSIRLSCRDARLRVSPVVPPNLLASTSTRGLPLAVVRSRKNSRLLAPGGGSIAWPGSWSPSPFIEKRRKMLRVWDPEKGSGSAGRIAHNAKDMLIGTVVPMAGGPVVGAAGKSASCWLLLLWLITLLAKAKVWRRIWEARRDRARTPGCSRERPTTESDGADRRKSAWSAATGFGGRRHWPFLLAFFWSMIIFVSIYRTPLVP